MNKEIKIRSHIYVAKSILKRFSRKDHNNHDVIDYLDTKLGKLYENVSISEFNRVLGYYTTLNEQRLKKYCEEKIGMVIKKLEICMDSNNQLKLDDNDKRILKTYLAYQWIRGDYLNKRIIKDFSLNIDLKDHKNVMIENEIENNTIYSCINDLGMCIVFNYTNKDFFLCCTSSSINADSKNRFIINVSLTPKILVRFCDSNELKRIFNLTEDYMLVKMIDDYSVVNENLLIYNTAVESTPHLIVGSLQELIRIRNLYETIKK